MAKFDREVSVYVTGRTLGELSFWTREFTAFFGGSTTVNARGSWEGETEDVHVVSHLYDQRDPDYKFYSLDQLLRKYKRQADQDAVLVVYREVKALLI